VSGYELDREIDGYVERALEMADRQQDKLIDELHVMRRSRDELAIERDALADTLAHVRRFAVRWAAWEHGESAAAIQMCGSDLLTVLGEDMEVAR
jgi:hypothetical protein